MAKSKTINDLEEKVIDLEHKITEIRNEYQRDMEKAGDVEDGIYYVGAADMYDVFLNSFDALKHNLDITNRDKLSREYRDGLVVALEELAEFISDTIK